MNPLEILCASRRVQAVALRLSLAAHRNLFDAPDMLKVNLVELNEKARLRHRRVASPAKQSGENTALEDADVPGKETRMALNDFLVRVWVVNGK